MLFAKRLKYLCTEFIPGSSKLIFYLLD